MALVIADRVKETTTTTGTGVVTLAGAVAGFQSFSSAIGNANTTYYAIAEQTGANWEVGIGTYTLAGTALSRDTVLASSNAGGLVNFTSGVKDVFATYPASRAARADSQPLVSSAVAKTGDTMTGNLVMSGNGVNFVSSRAGSDARNTGYKMADGQDIGEMRRSNQYYDDRVSNCYGYLPTGNCSSNVQYTPPNGNWWTWGVTGVPTGNCANNGAYDGVGGTSSTLNPVAVGFNYDAYYLGADEIGGGEYHRNYRNCNCGAFNCRTNCNCNCNCNCDCTC